MARTSRPWRRKTVLSVPEAGKVLGIGRNSAYEAARRKEIPTIRIGGRILVPVAALEKMLGITVAQHEDAKSE